MITCPILMSPRFALNSKCVFPIRTRGCFHPWFVLIFSSLKSVNSPTLSFKTCVSLKTTSDVSSKVNLRFLDALKSKARFQKLPERSTTVFVFSCSFQIASRISAIQNRSPSERKDGNPRRFRLV